MKFNVYEQDIINNEKPLDATSETNTRCHKNNDLFNGKNELQYGFQSNSYKLCRTYRSMSTKNVFTTFVGLLVYNNLTTYSPLALTLKMEASHSFKMFVSIYNTPQCHNPEDYNLSSASAISQKLMRQLYLTNNCGK